MEHGDQGPDWLSWGWAGDDSSQSEGAPSLAVAPSSFPPCRSFPVGTRVVASATSFSQVPTPNLRPVDYLAELLLPQRIQTRCNAGNIARLALTTHEGAFGRHPAQATKPRIECSTVQPSNLRGSQRRTIMRATSLPAPHARLVQGLPKDASVSILCDWDPSPAPSLGVCPLFERRHEAHQVRG